MKRRYSNISIPHEVMERIDRHIADPSLGYSSRTQFILEAVRDKFREMEERDSK